VSLVLGYIVFLASGLVSLISGYISYQSVGILVTVEEQVITARIIAQVLS
jgi:hypothetical protein